MKFKVEVRRARPSHLMSFGKSFVFGFVLTAAGVALLILLSL
jgi:hypothetical protein